MNIETYKIELRNIKHSVSLSQETEAFTADIYIDGRKVAYAHNEGTGGPTGYGFYKTDDRQLLQQLEAYCKTLPPVFLSEQFPSVEQNLESVIDDLLTKHLAQKEIDKFDKKARKLFATHIIAGPAAEKIGEYRNFKPSHPIQAYLTSNANKEVLKKLIAKVKAKLVTGEVILNDNIPVDILAIEAEIASA